MDADLQRSLAVLLIVSQTGERLFHVDVSDDRALVRRVGYHFFRRSAEEGQRVEFIGPHRVDYQEGASEEARAVGGLPLTWQPFGHDQRSRLASVNQSPVTYDDRGRPTGIGRLTIEYVSSRTSGVTLVRAIGGQSVKVDQDGKLKGIGLSVKVRYTNDPLTTLCCWLNLPCD